MKTLTLAELAAELGGVVVGDGATVIRGVAGIRESQPGDITFLANARYDETKLSFLKDFAFPDELAAIRRLKAIPEAMWYWSLAARIG